jgi:PAS domain S-box-containing protein
MVTLDADGRVMTWNRAAERLHGWCEKEIVGRHVSTFYSQADVTPFLPGQHLRRALLEHGHAEERWSVRKDGSRFWTSVIISPLLRLDGTVYGFGMLTRDCTEQRKLDHELHAERDDLVASVRKSVLMLHEVHHRIKNNLQVISSMISMQARTMSDEPSRRALEQCRGRVQTLAGIHDKLHAAGDRDCVPFAQYAEDLVRDVFDGAGAAVRGILLELELDDLALSADQAVPCALILNELIVNAIKHGFPNGRQGKVGVQFHKRTPGDLLLRVWDDGVGMPARHFDPDSSGRRGLGMKLVSALIQQLGGRLEVLVVGGTALHVTFPSQQERGVGGLIGKKSTGLSDRCP